MRLRKARDDKCVECLIYPPHRALTMKFGPRRILPLLIALFTVLSATWIMAGGRNAEGFSGLLMFRVNKLLSEDGYTAGSFVIGLTADRSEESSVEKSVHVRAALGGRRIIKKKINTT